MRYPLSSTLQEGFLFYTVIQPEKKTAYLERRIDLQNLDHICDNLKKKNLPYKWIYLSILEIYL